MYPQIYYEVMVRLSYQRSFSKKYGCCLLQKVKSNNEVIAIQEKPAKF